MTPRAVLVGAPGAGKTVVGRLLAERLGVAFTDTDAAVEASAGMPVGEIFVTQGEAHFRDLERAAVADAIAESDGVVALGGGAVLDPGTRGLLRETTTVWLEVDLGTALARVGMNRARPLLLGNVRGQLRTLLAERTPLYQEVATVRVDAAGTPEQVVEAVLAALPPTDPR